MCEANALKAICFSVFFFHFFNSSLLAIDILSTRLIEWPREQWSDVVRQNQSQVWVCVHFHSFSRNAQLFYLTIDSIVVPRLLKWFRFIYVLIVHLFYLALSETFELISFENYIGSLVIALHRECMNWRKKDNIWNQRMKQQRMRRREGGREREWVFKCHSEKCIFCCPFIGSISWRCCCSMMVIWDRKTDWDSESERKKKETKEKKISRRWVSLRQEDMLYYTWVLIKRQQHLQNFIDANRRTMV